MASKDWIHIGTQGGLRMYGNDAGFAVGQALNVRGGNKIEPPPSTPIMMGLICRNGDLKELHEALGELERRLGPVLRHEGPTGNGTGASNVAPIRSEVTEQIERIGEGILSAKSRIGVIIERLDI